ncbi:MAG: hypothetical protein KGL39_49325 [Patescibacteria group bacterium]|nr:hypothetical protein [Patescibacteria group bacterium]
MQQWLAAEGVTADTSTIGRFLESLRSQRAQERILQLVASGSAQCQEVDRAFAKNPEPQLESLIKLLKTLIFQLTIKGAADPDALSLANQLTTTVCNFVSSQTKAVQKNRELDREDAKFAESKKDEQTKALELCLEDAKAFPEVIELFRAAFAALKRAKSK